MPAGLLLVMCDFPFVQIQMASFVTGNSSRRSSFSLNLKDLKEKCSVCNLTNIGKDQKTKSCWDITVNNVVHNYILIILNGHVLFEPCKCKAVQDFFSLVVTIGSFITRQSLASVALNVSKKAEAQSRKSVKVQKLILVSSCTERRSERTENTAGPEPKPTGDTSEHAGKHSAPL